MRPLLLLGLLVFSVPLVLNNPYYLNVLAIVGLNAMVAVGLSLFIGYA
ncbi:MAG: branched-chain amino acid ABC transporter permease, partial [Thermodesulfobacteria bacterium]|nr:branched-chain amino acid ABC transporter permease [Thermodesulfobacteriota bacterium]